MYLGFVVCDGFMILVVVGVNFFVIIIVLVERLVEMVVKNYSIVVDYEIKNSKFF